MSTETARLSLQITDAVRRLPRRVRKLLTRRVRFAVYDHVRAVDVERSRGLVGPEAPGYFWGVPVAPASAGELEAEEGADVAEPARGEKPGGLIIAFAANLRNYEDVETFVRHEVAHFLGADEDDVTEAGLADPEESTVVEVEVLDGDD